MGNSTGHPNTITTDYIRTVAAFGSLTEVRAGWLTQDLPVFVRMIDKDSNWSWVIRKHLFVYIQFIYTLNIIEQRSPHAGHNAATTEYGWISIGFTRHDRWQRLR